MPTSVRLDRFNGCCVEVKSFFGLEVSTPDVKSVLVQPYTAGVWLPCTHNSQRQPVMLILICIVPAGVYMASLFDD